MSVIVFEGDYIKVDDNTWMPVVAIDNWDENGDADLLFPTGDCINTRMLELGDIMSAGEMDAKIARAEAYQEAA